MRKLVFLVALLAAAATQASSALARCEVNLAIDETLYSSGVGYAPMTIQLCELPGTKDVALSIYYGRPSPNGQPSGRLFYKARVNRQGATGWSISAPQPVADFGDGTNCGPISYNVIVDDNNDPNGNWLRVWGQMPLRDRNCMLTGRTAPVTRVFRIQLPATVGGGTSGRTNALGQLGSFLGCLANPNSPGC